jgi:mono/diheme cytochrome c family protein
VDDRVTYERQKAKADHEFAKDAIDAVIAGKAPAVTEAETAGCLINFKNRAENAASLTYTAAIAPIIQSKCVVCHQPGGIGPMPLTSYEKVRAYAPMIREVLRTQRMPPWRADPTVGHFKDDKSLSSEQIATMVHWVEAGTPRGTGPDTLAAVEYKVAEWPLGVPDLILDVPAYKIPANGIVDYQRPFAINPLKEDKWVRASTIKVVNRQAVHHILTGYLADPPAPGQQAFEDKWGASMGAYAVGAESEVSPKDVGTLLPAGGAVAFQNHYTPYGKEVTEASKIALYFYDKKPKLMMRNSVIVNPNISIGPNEEAHKETAYLVFPKDALLYSAFPHAHYRGSNSQLTIRYPDGTEKTLLSLPKYDFNWQREYTFAEPIKVPAGSWLIATYLYDNSKRNPANPDPNRTVPWGEQSFDEMLYTALRYRWIDETSSHVTNYDDALNASRLMGILDTNLDGKIQFAELRGKMGENLKANFKMIDKNGDGAIDVAELAAVQSYMREHRRHGPAPAPAQAAAPAAAPTAPHTSGASR